MTFGMPAGVKSRLPGSTRLGQWARWKSRPARRPDPDSSSRSSGPSVVPGGTGDSRITVVCGRSCAARVRAADSTWPRSSPPSAAGAVGAQITAVRTRPSSAALVVTRKPWASMRRCSAGLREPGSGPVRYPMVGMPAATAAWARGSPNGPSPMTARSAGMAWAVLPNSRSATGAQALWTGQASAMSD
ncbi:hypothetical protein SALBM217S_00238 [Streptomyces griseoloalbus]